jgi:anti-sigma B factor antagonist
MSNPAIFTVEQPSKGVLILKGEVDLSNAPRVKPLLDEWLGQRLTSYTLDLRGLQRIDSSGLGLVVGAYRRAITQEDPKAEFKVQASGAALRVIRLIGLDRVLPVEGGE